MSVSPPFRGFPAGGQATPVPNLFFADLLPAIDDPAELLTSLYLFYVLGRKRVAERWTSEAELQAEAPLCRALARLPGGVPEALARGLAGSVRRGTVVRFQGGGEWRYTLNSALHRRLAGGQSQAAGTEEPPLPAAEGERPTVYTLYEENLGALTPLIAEELRAAEEAYPAAWLEDAVREAVRMNRRNWRYVQRILERWRDEGRDDATVGRDTGGPRDLAGRYRGLIRR